MSVHTIEVTKEIIRRHRSMLSNSCCPIAMAIRQQLKLNKNEVNVQFTDVVIKGKRIKLPQKATLFMIDPSHPDGIGHYFFVLDSDLWNKRSKKYYRKPFSFKIRF